MVTLLPAWQDDKLSLVYDDMISLANNFKQNKIDVHLMLVQYLPSLRYLLHRYNLLETDWWNVFDEIQNIGVREGQPADVTDLTWPISANRVYSRSGMFIYEGRTKIASAEVSSDSYLSAVHYYDEGTENIDVYDDRGFITSHRTLANGQLQEIQWFNEHHQLIMTANADGEIQIDSDQQQRFDQQSYGSLQDIVVEFVNRHLQEHQIDQIVAAADETIIEVADQIDDDVQCHFVVQYDSSHARIQPEAVEVLNRRAQTVVVPLQSLVEPLKQQLTAPQILSHAPYSTDLDLGVSNEQDNMKIFWNVDHANNALADQVVYRLIQGTIAHDDWELSINTDSKEQSARFLAQIQQLVQDQYSLLGRNDEVQTVRSYLRSMKEKALFQDQQEAIDRLKKMPFWSNIRVAAGLLERIEVKENENQKKLLKDLDTARVVVDLAPVPNLFVQIQAISAGIPQINTSKSEYVIPSENGTLINKASEIDAALDYFLAVLRNWNVSLIKNIDLIEKYSSVQLVEFWKDILANGRA
ncbi:accessory Sec system protein Asp1 [Paucilactobacillus suebicus]|uniref:Accessory Sec system protein Asp1 n=1 Tax=Paucilactobacillus suebicus DSM 5007 = KCTC 3549 TaxID=1423807 RepID=A0A0R1VWT8_9LACO|nr:accessory Sec system protein Asp1 [Paucilactobacillus suebicus]KRM09938.1 hypothetical protein FD16_GL001478 [Paucilactobacillus suebicus DSM 5007 = KCTC 3549]